jgi:hypothetical protein
MSRRRSPAATTHAQATGRWGREAGRALAPPLTPFQADADATIRLTVAAEQLGYARFGSAEGWTHDAVEPPPGIPDQALKRIWGMCDASVWLESGRLRPAEWKHWRPRTGCMLSLGVVTRHLRARTLQGSLRPAACRPFVVGDCERRP